MIHLNGTNKSDYKIFLCDNNNLHFYLTIQGAVQIEERTPNQMLWYMWRANPLVLFSFCMSTPKCAAKYHMYLYYTSISLFNFTNNLAFYI